MDVGRLHSAAGQTPLSVQVICAQAIASDCVRRTPKRGQYGTGILPVRSAREAQETGIRPVQA